MEDFDLDVIFMHQNLFTNWEAHASHSGLYAHVSLLDFVFLFLGSENLLAVFRVRKPFVCFHSLFRLPLAVVCLYGCFRPPLAIVRLYVYLGLHWPLYASMAV